MHILKVMSNPPNSMIKREKLLRSKWQQGESYTQDIRGMHTELSKGAESEKERSTTRPGTGA